MSKPRLTAILAAISLFPMAAFAERLTPVSVTIEYDSAALSTNQGATETLEGIKEAAFAACRVDHSTTALAHIDKTCAKTLITQAVEKIEAANTASGLAIAPAFSQSAQQVFAAYEQR